MRKILMLLGLLIIGLFLVSCTPVEDEQDFPLEEDEANIAGQAVKGYKCTDSDVTSQSPDGKNYEVLGYTNVTTIRGIIIFTDKCKNSTRLREYYCSGFVEKTCKNGCLNGVCDAESGPQNISYDLLKEVFPESNSISENRINLIFDCRNMNKEEFESCVNYLWRFFNDEPSNIPGISFGLFQIEPFKSNQDQFNVWYLDRNLLNPNFAFNTTNQSCERFDTSFYYESSLQNVILISLCQGEYSDAHSTLFPIMPKTPVMLIKEKEAGLSIDPLGPGIKSVVSMGVNKNEMMKMGQDPAALGWSGVFTHEMGHALGGLIDEYNLVLADNPVDKEKTSIEPPSTLQEFKVQAEFPNCAPNIKTADLWWKETGLISNDQNYVNGCAGNYYIIPYKYTWMSEDSSDSSGNLAISSADELFSPIHRYWICRNIYNMTGLVEGVCQDFSELGFNGLLYSSN